MLNRIPDGPTGAIAYMSSQGGSGWKSWIDEYKDFVEADTWDEAIKILEAKGGKGGLPGYQISKRAITYYTKYLAAKLGTRNIRVNCVSPGNTVTGLIEEFRSYSGSYENSKAMWGAIRREGTAREMANAIVFLNSNLAEMISGADLAVDGASRSTIDIGFREDIMNGPTFGMNTHEFSEKSATLKD